MDNRSIIAGLLVTEQNEHTHQYGPRTILTLVVLYNAARVSYLGSQDGEIEIGTTIVNNAMTTSSL